MLDSLLPPQQGQIWALDGKGVVAVKANAGAQLRPKAEARNERTLEGVSCRALLGKGPVETTEPPTNLIRRWKMVDSSLPQGFSPTQNKALDLCCHFLYNALCTLQP